jgi:hypothetical protein
MPRTSSVRAVTTIGIDMGKNTLHMVGFDSLGAIVLRERVSRGRITSRLANLPPCLIGIEAGMATHYARRVEAPVIPASENQHNRRRRKLVSSMPSRPAFQPADRPAFARLIPRVKMRCSRSG